MRKAAVLLGLLSIFGLAACDLKVSTTTGTQNNATAKDPVIQVFTSNPASSGTWDQAFTFSVEAYSPGNNVLKYNWTSTDGTLSSTSGKLTSWTPPKKAGTFTVQVSVIDSVTGGQASGNANITITADGTVTVAK